MDAPWQAALFARRYLGVLLGLEAVRAAHVALGSPGADIPAIHVLGTNGKGSTAATCAHALRHGRKVGLYTSPHLHRIGERIRVAGVAIADDEVQRRVDAVLALDERLLPRPLTFFEILTLAALLHFEAEGVDLMVLEAGLGGRLDATRVARFAVTLFAPIDLDHMAYLGPDLSAIASEKAAALEGATRALSAPQAPEVAAVLQAHAARYGVPLRFVEPLARAPEGLAGAHQRVNAALALAGAQALDPTITVADLDGVRWPGRLERVAVGGGHLILDVAHNPHGMAALVEFLAHEERPAAPRAVLFGCLADKDAATMLAQLAALGLPLWLTTPPGGGHTLTAAGARDFPDPDAPALREAIRAWLADGGELVICGSHHLVGHLRAALLGAEVDARWLGDPLAR